VFRGKIPPKGKSGSNADSAVEKMIHEVKERFKQLYDYAQTGDVDSAVMTAKIINQKADELVEVAKRNEKPTERAKAATA
jgi:hypothetical protein